YDMAGNVQEWTSTRLEPYPYHEHDGREDPSDRSVRVLRGGSWGYDDQDARTAYRSFDDADYYDVGGRLVRESVTG
ncbi:MAG TPA: SUMF1/EgtB/PvdO family nonheme iron enzyme, partial [Ktedonobacterales bacterium]|nr:SUMF1/EgtB/PvdO family nonheme iron enzyme [Ktedonobacterales bacterium]